VAGQQVGCGFVGGALIAGRRVARPRLASSAGYRRMRTPAGANQTWRTVCTASIPQVPDDRPVPIDVLHHEGGAMRSPVKRVLVAAGDHVGHLRGHRRARGRGPWQESSGAPGD
jgi:hypothetical protein